MSTTDESSSSSRSSVSATRLICSRNSSTVSTSLRRADQLGQVLEPALGLDRALGLELGEVAATARAAARAAGRGRSARSVGRRRRAGSRNASMPLTALPPTPASSARRRASMNGRPVGGGPGVEPADRRVAHAPLGLVDDPLDRHLVDRVDDRPQVGDGVLDLPPVVEAGAADHLVGDAGPHELLFQHPALGVGAVEDGDVAPVSVPPCRPRPRPVVQAGDLAGDPLGLVDLVVGVVADDRVAGALVGPQLLGLAADVVGDDGVGGVEDGLRRPVVLLEQHHRGVGERRPRTRRCCACRRRGRRRCCCAPARRRPRRCGWASTSRS